MTDHKKRRFMKQSVAFASGLVFSRGAVTRQQGAVASQASQSLDPAVLEAVGRIVLPMSSLGEKGLGGVLLRFDRWLRGLEPVAEFEHPYLWTDEIQYGPSHPGPLWASQLEALKLEAQKRYGRPYTELPQQEQERILRRQLPKDVPAEIPPAESAPHVAIGVLAFFYSSSQANDLCYRAAIERHTCRGLDAAPERPAPLGD